MRIFTEEDVVRWNSLVGKRVWKNPKTTTKTQPKPFKSGSKVNTVRDVKRHPITNHLAFAFDEDESLVECFRCSLAPEPFVPDDVGPRGTSTPKVFEAMGLEDEAVRFFMNRSTIIKRF